MSDTITATMARWSADLTYDQLGDGAIREAKRIERRIEYRERLISIGLDLVDLPLLASPPRTWRDLGPLVEALRSS